MVSYGELNNLADRFATILSDRGVEKGDRAAIYTQNNPQFLVAQYGAWKRGTVVLSINPMLKKKELDYHLNDSGTKVLVCLESLCESVAREVVSDTAVEHVLTTSEIDLLPEGAAESTAALEDSERLRPEGTEDLLEALHETTPDSGAREFVAPEDTAYVDYTSRLTGQPKDTVETHSEVGFNSEVYRSWMQIVDEDSVFGAAPLFYTIGLTSHIGLAGYAGVPLVLSHRFDPEEAIRLIEKWQPTMTIASITGFMAMMNAPGSETSDLSSLAKCYSGGAPVAPSIVDQFEEKFDVCIHIGYGLTESNSPTHIVLWGTRAPVDEESGAISVGVPIPNCEARLVDVEDPSEEVTVSESGEFSARGLMIFAGYWNKETEEAFHDGYFLTGDVAVMDEDG